jgi:hypothetical protein
MNVSYRILQVTFQEPNQSLVGLSERLQRKLNMEMVKGDGHLCRLRETADIADNEETEQHVEHGN